MATPTRSTRTMTLRQWMTSLGDAIPLADAPQASGLPALELARGIRRGELAVREFRAEDGRVFRMIRKADLDKFAEARPRITLEGMKHAFRHLAEGTTPAEGTTVTRGPPPTSSTSPPKVTRPISRPAFAGPHASPLPCAAHCGCASRGYDA